MHDRFSGSRAEAAQGGERRRDPRRCSPQPEMVGTAPGRGSMASNEKAGGDAPAPTEPVMIDAAASPSPPSPEAETFYAEVLRELAGLALPFLLSGTYAVAAYTGISRPTKDLDIFCKAGDLPRILS